MAIALQQFDREQALLASVIADINQYAASEWGDSLYKDIQFYISKTNNLFLERGFTSAMVIIHDYELNCRQKLQQQLKKVTVKMPTKVVVTFTDESVLEAVFQEKKE